MAAAVMAAMMGMMTLGGCGTASEKSETAALTESQAEGTDAKQASEDGKSQDLKEINVVLDWYPNAIHTFIYTAIERGYYAEEGLDVKVRFSGQCERCVITGSGWKGGDRHVLSAGCDPGGCQSGNEDQIHRCDRAVPVKCRSFFKG